MLGTSRANSSFAFETCRVFSFSPSTPPPPPLPYTGSSQSTLHLIIVEAPCYGLQFCMQLTKALGPKRPAICCWLILLRFAHNQFAYTLCICLFYQVDYWKSCIHNQLLTPTLLVSHIVTLHKHAMTSSDVIPPIRKIFATQTRANS